jgi:hypothetical protein
MAKVTINLPDGVFSALRRSPKEFVDEMRIAAALLSYSKATSLNPWLPRLRARVALVLWTNLRADVFRLCKQVSMSFARNVA